MSTNRGAWLPYKKARPVEIIDAPMPTPKSNEVVVKVHAVAINPADIAVQTMGVVYEDYPVIIGCDCAGEIVELGSDVEGYKQGDRVTVAVLSGAFQQYCPTTVPFAAKIPDHIPYNEACVLPLAMNTSSVCLFEKDMLALDYPKIETAEPKREVVLIWGGASALGSCAIQMAKAAGYEVAAIARQHNFEYCKRLGASHVFDYTNADVIQEIVHNLRGRQCAGVFCPILTEGAMANSAEIASQLDGNKSLAIAYPPGIPLNAKIPEGVQVHRCWHSSLFDSTAARYTFGTWLPAALQNGTMICAPEPEVVGHGLERIQDAMDKLAQGVSAKKIVVNIS